MAYLSNQDEENQQNASQPQSNFNIFNTASNVAKQSPTADQNGQSNNSSDQYSISLSGASGDSGKQPSTGGSRPNVSGLGSNTPGGGYINFQSYANANPGTSADISTAGSNLVRSEQKNARLDVNPDMGFSTALPVYGGKQKSPSYGDVYNQLKNDNGGLDTVKGWLNESYKTPSYGYNPSNGFMEDSSELSETPAFGGAKPSVIDYLARSNIQAGNYNLGNRSLDQALIAGDPLAQQAIRSNQNKFASMTNDISKKLGDLNTQVESDKNLAPLVASGTQNILNAISTGDKASVDQAIADYNSKIEHAKRAEAQAYLDWYNKGGYTNSNFDINNTAASMANASNIGTTNADVLNQEIELNKIAKIQGMAEPYPGVSAAGEGPSQGNYSYNVGQGSAALKPSDYIKFGENPNEGFTGILSAVEHGTPLNQQQVMGFLGKFSPGQLQGIYGNLEQQKQTAMGKTDLYGNPIDNGKPNQKMLDQINQEEAYVSQAIKSNLQTPQSLIASLGLTPEDLAAFFPGV